MNRLQANLCLLCVTLFWSAEVVLYACIPDGVPAGIVDHVTLTPRIALGAALVVAGSIAEIADFGGRHSGAGGKGDGK